MNSSVKVPSKILGVLGGMGPAATAEFLRLLAIKAPARSDQEHPKLYVLSNPQIPDRSSAILGRGEDPTPFLKEGLLSLVQWGAQVLAVPCNTAHFFIDTFRKELPVPLIHIVEATVGLAAERSSEGAWLLATSGTKQSGMYERYAEKVGYPFFFPTDEDQKKVQESIVLVKANRLREGGVLLQGVVERLWKERHVPIVAACTELPLAYDASDLPEEGMISSLGALTEACLRELYSENK